ncbi:MAG: patatin-like phospholipase family protein [Planctomycetota bacterium]
MSAGGLGLVLTGGGARGAYQVGVLRAFCRAAPGADFDVLTGVSAGALNAAFLAGADGPLAERVERLRDLWLGLEVGAVIEVADRWFLKNVLRVGLMLLGGGRGARLRTRGLVDTGPLAELLAGALDVAPDGRLRGVAKQVAAGRHRAVAVTGSCYASGRTVTWVAHDPAAAPELKLWERPNRVARAGDLRLEHVLASSALPLLFPAIAVDGAWFGDGGVRLTAPLAPAIHLGADRLLTIATRFAGRDERPPIDAADGKRGYPPPALVAGNLLNAIFLDLVDQDVLHLERINALVSGLPPEQRLGLKRVQQSVVRPSENLGTLANDFEARLPRGLRFLTRGLGTRETRSNDFLSLLMFQRDYVEHLIETGERDGAAHAAEFAALAG